MTLYDKYRETDYLDDISFIAGTDITLKFTVYNADGNPIDVRNTPSSSMKWLLGYYGQPEIDPILEKNATFSYDDYNSFEVNLTAEDTIDLGADIYLQQMIITDGANKKIRPAQGIVIIRKAIPTSS